VPDRQSPTELLRSTDDATGAFITAGWPIVADGVGSTQWAAGGFGNAELNIEGGQDVINAIGTTGAAEDIDPTFGNVITSTLGDDTVFTILQPVGSGASTLLQWVSTGAGGFTPTWDADGGTFAWDGGVTPTLVTTAGVTYRVVFERIPGTTNDWIGNLVGGGSSSSALWVPVTTFDGTNWMLAVDGDGNAIMTEA
jgi:hypothetical protein